MINIVLLKLLLDAMLGMAGLPARRIWLELSRAT